MGTGTIYDIVEYAVTSGVLLSDDLRSLVSYVIDDLMFHLCYFIYLWCDVLYY